jgi:hypothetical protein
LQLEALRGYRHLPEGEASLQNTLSCAIQGLAFVFPLFSKKKMHSQPINCRSVPSHAARELLIVGGFITTCDPGDIHETLAQAVAERIRVSFVSMSASIQVCNTISRASGGKHAVRAETISCVQL